MQYEDSFDCFVPRNLRLRKEVESFDDRLEHLREVVAKVLLDETDGVLALKSASAGFVAPYLFQKRDELCEATVHKAEGCEERSNHEVRDFDTQRLRFTDQPNKFMVGWNNRRLEG